MLYANGDGGWALTAPGLEFVGEPGEWERVISENEALNGEVEPLWLLQLISAAVEAEDKGNTQFVASRAVASARWRASPSLRLTPSVR